MARTVLTIGALAWLLGGAAVFVLAAVGTGWLLARLPPLAIDADALGGALTALALTLVATGTAHLFVVAGLREGRRWARSAGALQAGVLAVVCVALAATAISSAFRESASALPLLAAAVVAGSAATAYVLAAVQLARELGSGPGT